MFGLSEPFEAVLTQILTFIMQRKPILSERGDGFGNSTARRVLLPSAALP